MSLWGGSAIGFVVDQECTTTVAGKQRKNHLQTQRWAHPLSQQPHAMMRVHQSNYLFVHLMNAEGHLVYLRIGMQQESATLLVSIAAEMVHMS